MFAWSYEDMPGIDPEIDQHHIDTYDHMVSIKQKLRRMRTEWLLKIKEEVTKQLKVGFIKPINQAKWIANVVPVPKKDRKVRMCLASRMLRQLIKGCLWPCYMTMHNEVEEYVDYMIVKSKDRGSHTTNLIKFFERIKEYRLRLNPQQCTFGVIARKLLGFLVSDGGIEVDPSKIKAILEMPPPKSGKEIRSFLGQLQYISQFIAKLTSTCEPTFKLLRKNEPHTWNDEC